MNVTGYIRSYWLHPCFCTASPTLRFCREIESEPTQTRMTFDGWVPYRVASRSCDVLLVPCRLVSMFSFFDGKLVSNRGDRLTYNQLNNNWSRPPRRYSLESVSIPVIIFIPLCHLFVRLRYVPSCSLTLMHFLRYALV